MTYKATLKAEYDDDGEEDDYGALMTVMSE